MKMSELRNICDRLDVADLRDLAKDIGFPQKKIPANPSPQELSRIVCDWVERQGRLGADNVVLERWAATPKPAVCEGGKAVAEEPPAQIFLSGTSDLNHYKRKAFQVAEYFGVSAWMDIDYRGVGRPRQVCLEGVLQCERFFLFLGARYGQVPTGLDISPTEDEYQQARAAGKPIYVFVERVPAREERQVAFLERVRSYSTGNWRWTFKSTEEIGDLVREILEKERRPAGGEA